MERLQTEKVESRKDFLDFANFVEGLKGKDGQAAGMFRAYEEGDSDGSEDQGAHKIKTRKKKKLKQKGFQVARNLANVDQRTTKIKEIAPVPLSHQQKRRNEAASK